MRRNVIRTTLLVALLVMMLMPLVHVLSIGQGAIDANDAEHMVKPMLAMLAESPQRKANTAVEPMLELEDAWAIEDTREESWEEPLVVGMRNGDDELGFDRASNTFYCTLGMEDTGDWPELALFAQGAQGTENLRVAWIDDYSYDYRSDAIREGYRYELLAYTDTQYAYFGMVFTGLPLVTLHVQDGIEVGDQYVPARVSVADGADTSVVEMAQIHIRGNEKHIPKRGYRVEFHEITHQGRDGKKAVSLLGMDADTDYLLLCNAQDETTVRNKLCFDMWNRWNEDDHALLMQESHLVEVFFQNEYQGIYQLMERVNPQKDILAAGGNADLDCLVRLGGNREGLNQADFTQDADISAEYEYEAKGNVHRAFRLFEDYVELNRIAERLNDEEFAELAEKRLDMDNMLSYYLFIQSFGLTMDNALNNLYIWTAWEDGDYQYRFAPWDMDFGIMRAEYQEDGSPVRYFEMRLEAVKRMLDLDVCGAREKLWSIWNEKKQKYLSYEVLENWIGSMEEEMNRSGAYLRESAKWLYGERLLDLSAFLEFEKEQVRVIDAVLLENWPIN